MATSAAKLFAVVDLSIRSLVSIALVGAGVGVLTWLVSLLMQTIFVEPVFCRSADSFSACANGGTIAIVISTIVANMLGLVALVKLGVYRPLLIVLAAIVTLFGVHSWAGSLVWYEATVWYALVYSAAYALYAWTARLKSFAITMVVLLVLIVGFRVFLAQL